MLGMNGPIRNPPCSTDQVDFSEIAMHHLLNILMLIEDNLIPQYVSKI